MNRWNLGIIDDALVIFGFRSGILRATTPVPSRKEEEALKISN